MTTQPNIIIIIYLTSHNNFTQHENIDMKHDENIDMKHDENIDMKHDENIDMKHDSGDVL